MIKRHIFKNSKTILCILGFLSSFTFLYYLEYSEDVQRARQKDGEKEEIPF